MVGLGSQVSWNVKVTEEDSGKTVFLGSDELVSFQMPFTPVFYNPGFRTGLNAAGLRHETRWYESEHKFLTKVLRMRPDLDSAVDWLRLEIYAVFCRQAELMGPGPFVRKARMRFEKAYRVALCKGIVKGAPEQFLAEVRSSDYLGSRMLLIEALSKSG